MSKALSLDLRTRVLAAPVAEAGQTKHVDLPRLRPSTLMLARAGACYQYTNRPGSVVMRETFKIAGCAHGGHEAERPIPSKVRVQSSPPIGDELWTPVDRAMPISRHP